MNCAGGRPADHCDLHRVARFKVLKLARVSILAKLTAGGPGRRSRFHDEKGHFLDFAGWLYLPFSLGTLALRLLGSSTSSGPWLGFRAARHLETLLNANAVAVEFGSGASTLWLAGRVGRLLSIEHDLRWHQRVRHQVGTKRFTRVDMQLRTIDNYPDLSLLPDGSVDFALIDGIRRAACVREVLPKLKPGALVYLDNSDKGGDCHEAEELLVDAASATDGSVRYFVDLIPGYLFVTEGMLVRVGASRGMTHAGAGPSPSSQR